MSYKNNFINQKAFRIILSCILFLLILRLFIPVFCYNLLTVIVKRSIVEDYFDLSIFPFVEDLFVGADFQEIVPPRLQYWKGLASSLTGHEWNAIESWRAFPEASYWLTLSGRFELINGNFDKALSIFEVALTLEPASSTIFYYEGLALYQKGQYIEALDKYNSALRFSQFDNRFINPVLEIGSDTGVWWPARPGDVRLFPTKAHTYIQMSAIYFTLRQWDEMQKVSQYAVALDPDNPLGYFQLARAYFMRGRSASIPLAKDELYELAEETLLLMKDKVPQHQYPYFLLLARIYSAEGKALEAAEIYEQALAGSPPIPYYLSEVINFYSANGQGEKAVSLCDNFFSQMSGIVALVDDCVSVNAPKAGQNEKGYIFEDRDSACELIALCADINGAVICEDAITVFDQLCGESQ